MPSPAEPNVNKYCCDIRLLMQVTGSNPLLFKQACEFSSGYASCFQINSIEVQSEPHSTASAVSTVGQCCTQTQALRVSQH